VSKPIPGVSSISSQRNGAILIISIIGHHEKIRFNDKMQSLDGISPKTLADALKDLG
jgi:DNA-binding HxlR family transcriptional regulator